MHLEIERRFLATGDVRRFCLVGERIVQGYIHAAGLLKIRIRIMGSKGFLTIKGPRVGCTRTEFEHRMPAALAVWILSRVTPEALIEKIRYKVAHAGLVWDVDIFEGRNGGLIIAEVELPEPRYPVVLPAWVDREVTTDMRYGNSVLAHHPVQTDARSLRNIFVGEQRS